MQLGYFIVAFALFSLASANHPAPPGGPIRNKDFCVETNGTDGVFIGGKYCKVPFLLTEKDFTTSGLYMPGDTNNPFGSSHTPVEVDQLPALNGLGVSMARSDFAPGGVASPHIHPRATKMMLVMSGTIEVGFVTSNPNYTHYRKVLKPGDVFVHPKGLVHYSQNPGNKSAVVIIAYNNDLPGRIHVGKAAFGSYPTLPMEVLTKSFQLAKNILLQLIAFFKFLHFSDEDMVQGGPWIPLASRIL